MMAIPLLKKVLMLLAVIDTIIVASTENIADADSSNKDPFDQREDLSEGSDMDVEEVSPGTEDESDETRLLEAASLGDVSLLEKVLQSVCHDLIECPAMITLLRKRDALGNTALHLAAQSGSVEAVNFLLEYGALADARHYNLHKPLRMACAAGHANIVENLGDSLGKLTVNLRDYSGNTAFTQAILAGHLDVVKVLAPFSDAYTIGDGVITAAEKGNIKIAKAILQSGVCLERKKLLTALTLVWEDLRSHLDFLFVYLAHFLND